MGVPRAIALLVVLLSASAATVASAQPHDQEIAAAITIEGIDTCLDPASLVSQVAHFLGRDRIADRIHVAVRPSVQADTFDLVRGDEVIGQRTLEAAGATCEQRRAALGLMIALAIDATLLDELQTPIQAEPVAIAALGIDVGGWLGLFPSAAGAAALRLEVTLTPWLGLEAAAMGALAPDTAFSVGTVSTSLAAGRLSLCPMIRLETLRIDGCVGAAAGALFASGHGFSHDLSVALPWVSVLIGASVRHALTRSIALRLGLDLSVSVLSPELSVTSTSGEARAAIDLSPVGGGVWLGVVFAIY